MDMQLLKFSPVFTAARQTRAVSPQEQTQATAEGIGKQSTKGASAPEKLVKGVGSEKQEQEGKGNTTSLQNQAGKSSFDSFQREVDVYGHEIERDLFGKKIERDVFGKEIKEEMPEEEKLEKEKVEKEKKEKDSQECETCKERKYQDGSNDPSVSFKTPTAISPERAAAAVRSHEMEHVFHEQAKAKREGREVVSQFVTYNTGICPECHRIYISGGQTTTVTRNARSSDFQVGIPKEETKGKELDAVA